MMSRVLVNRQKSRFAMERVTALSGAVRLFGPSAIFDLLPGRGDQPILVMGGSLPSVSKWIRGRVVFLTTIQAASADG